MTIVEPGIYAIGEAAYHADPCAVPSLSRTIARVICDQTPAHAYVEHPRLGAGAAGEAAERGDTKADLGTAVHAAFLAGEDRVAVIEADAFNTNAAKAARDAARKAGRIPLLGKHVPRLEGMLRSLERYRAATGAFTNGKAEQTIVWREGEAWCRCRVDWMSNDPTLSLLDLKSTGAGATPDTWATAAWSAACDIQSAFYGRGVGSVRGEMPLRSMAFVVIENEPPYAIRTFGLTPEAEEIGEARTRYALDVWTACMAKDHWPAFDDEVQFVEAPYRIRNRWAHLTQTGGGDRAVIEAKRRELVGRMLATRSMGG